MGMLVVAAALLSPLDEMADALFAAHMAQHVLLAVIAPPLLVAGAPVTAALWTVSPGTRRHITETVKRSAVVRGVWRAMTAPAVAWAIHAAVFWLWHLPRLYTAAVSNEAIHALEHLSFVTTAALVWWGILHPRTSRRAGYLVGIMVLFATMMQSGALGAIMTLSPHAWYPVHAAGVAAWHTTLVEDQQLAGLIMWVGGSVLYVMMMSILFLAWLRSARRADQRANQHARRRAPVAALAAAAVLSTTACGRAAAVRVPGGDAARGRTAIASAGCGGCHTISGITGANGRVGATLDGIGERSLIAGELPNTPENMTRWLLDPPAIEPTTAMPRLGLTDSTARDIAAYLYTLR